MSTVNVPGGKSDFDSTNPNTSINMAADVWLTLEKKSDAMHASK